VIRRHAVDLGVPLVTDLRLARAIVDALRRRRRALPQAIAWNDYLAGQGPAS
jgi:carbamoyl-phosphate synthase large subunit